MFYYNTNLIHSLFLNMIITWNSHLVYTVTLGINILCLVYKELIYFSVFPKITYYAYTVLLLVLLKEGQV